MAEYVFEKAKADLRKNILEGKWPRGEKMPSSRQLSKFYGCSVNTVERALKELEGEGLLVREPRKGTFVSETGISETRVRTGVAAAIVLAVEHPVWSSAVRGMEDYLYSNKYSLMVASHEWNIEKQESVIRSLVSRGVDGIILSPAARDGREPENRRLFDMLLNNGISVVFIDRVLYGLEHNIPYVSSDNIDGAYKLTKLLIDKGHKRIAFIKNLNSSTFNERLLGYKQALYDNGIEYDEGLEILVPVNDDADDCALDVLKERLNTMGITALFCANDMAAKMAWNVLNDMGIKVPRDLSFVTYDADAAAYLLPFKPTGICQPFYEMGKMAAKVLLERIGGQPQMRAKGYICQSRVQDGVSAASIK